MSTTVPDYEGLLKFLYGLKRFPDATGETVLTPAEAMKIRSLGFQADAGPWRVPPLPPELTRETIFESLSTGWGASRSEPQPIPVNAQKRARQPESSAWGMSQPDVPTRIRETKEHRLGVKILRAIERRGGAIERRRLQQLMSRHDATAFYKVLQELSANAAVHIEGEFIVTRATGRPGELCCPPQIK